MHKSRKLFLSTFDLQMKLNICTDLYNINNVQYYELNMNKMYINIDIQNKCFIINCTNYE